MIKRREFLVNSSLALGALAIAPSFAFATPKKSVGIQLWSLRDSFPKDVKGILKQLGKTGFNEVETYGYSEKEGFFGTSLQDFKFILDDNGLKASSNHFDINSIIKSNSNEQIKHFIEAANFLGSEYITIPSFDTSLYGNSAEGYKKIASEFNKLGLICKKGGLKLAYHNHAFEFSKMGSSNGYEILLSETDADLVDFEMDLYWVVRSGNHPLELFKKYPGRFKLWHVKDMDKINPEHNTEIGNGTIDFKSIFKQAKLSGMKHFYLEQESNYNPNPIESISKSINYIQKKLI